MEATGHTEVIDKAVAPTCTEAGATEGKHCSTCSTVFVAQEVLEAKGHKNDDNNSICDNCDHLFPGLYDSNDKLLASWDELANRYYMDVECNYDFYTSRNYNTSPYYVLTNNKGLENAKKLVIGEIKTIGNYAFFWCSSLTSINIPDSVTSIGEYAFSGCSSLTSINIPDSVTSIGKSAFSSCSSLTSITIPNSVTSIGDEAFWSCSSLTSITIPDGVTSIGDDAFRDCSSLTSITIPDGVTSIGEGAFVGCSSLESIVVGNNNSKYYSQGNCLMEKDTNTLILGCKNSIIPDGVTSIGKYAFYGCSSLTSITIPDSVTSIGKYAFYECSSLTSITIGNGVTSIGDDAFGGCSNLESIVVGNNNSKYYSQGNCLIEKDTNTLILGCKNSIISDSVTSIGEYAFWGCSLTSINIPDSVTSIGYNAFRKCRSLTSVTISNSVEIIDGCTFYECNSLTNVTIGNSVTSISWDAFYGCVSLTSITFEGSVAEWNAIDKDSDWNYDVPATEVVCSDGVVKLS